MDNCLEIINKMRKESLLKPIEESVLISPEKKKALEDSFIDLSLRGYQLIERQLTLEETELINEIQVEEGKKCPTLEECLASSKVFSLLEEKGNYQTFVEGALIPQKELEVDRSILLIFYNLGTKFLHDRELDKAEEIFAFLILLNPCINGFWLAKGLVNEVQQKWEAAVQSFSIAQELDPSVDLSYYGLIRVYEEIRDQEGLASTLELAEKHMRTFQQF